MLKWINKVLGDRGSSVPEGIPSRWVDRLEEFFKPVAKLPGDKVRDGLSRDMLAYVLHGEPLSVLHEVAQGDAVAAALRLVGFHYAEREVAQPNFYEDLPRVEPAAAVRLGRLLVAAAGAHHQTGFLMQLPPGAQWAEALLLNAAGWTLMGYSGQRPPSKGLTVKCLEGMLEAEDLPTFTLLRAAFSTPVDIGYGMTTRLALVDLLPDFADALDRHAQDIRQLLETAPVAQRLHMLTLLKKASKATLSLMAPELARLAVASSKQVRAAAKWPVQQAASACIEPLSAIAVDGKPEERMHALRSLWFIAEDTHDSALQATCRTIAAADKAPSVQALLSEWDGKHGDADSPPPETRFDYTVPTISWACDLSDPVTAQNLRDFWTTVNRQVLSANKSAREHHQAMLARGHKYPLTQLDEYTSSDMARLADLLASSNPPSAKPRPDPRAWGIVQPLLIDLAKQGSVTPVMLMKMLRHFSLDEANGQLGPALGKAFDDLHRKTGQPSLLELQVMLSAFGHTPDRLLKAYCSRWGTAIGREWADEAAWPFFAHHLDALLQAMNPAWTHDYWFDRAAVFKAISTLPKPPAIVVNALFDLALGTAKTERPAAQNALQNLPNKEARIINALADGKSEVRMVAAQWLGRLRHEAAVPALEQAVAREKQDIAKGAMIDALQAMGQPVEKYLDRQALAKDAAKFVAKGMPKEIEWFPWTRLPAVHWADTREAVAPEILQWMIGQAVKHKLPEPNAILRKYCAMFEPGDREAFGQFVLEAWLREDVRPISPDAALQRATSHAQAMHGYMQRSPQYYKDDPNFGRSEQELVGIYLPSFLKQPEGSAAGSKGMLAVAAACAAERAPAPVARYLKEHYGTRAAQGKALIAMLAWIEHPSATQLMLSIGNRFRTKSFQEEATRQAEALADRKGWTLSELADRTIPSGGFDETGTLELSYGQRAFTARLLPDFKVELYNPDGKKIASLPEPRQDDDANLAKDAKKAFSAARKEIKSIVELQTDRLYEALCTGRDWSFEDWSLYLNQHPIVRRLIQRLVWVEQAGDSVVQSFRPLDDGTLTNLDDDEVTLAPQARVRVAHDSLLSPDDVARWQQHLADYEIAPLFQQLGKGTYVLPADKANDDSVKDFEGHLLEAFALRGRALKLGYMRGPAEDGGWFHVYNKRFATLGLEAVIEFTGNPLPEENRTVALISLTFASTQDASSYNRSRLPLNKVPAVLLSECYNDLRLIASEGTGFDKDWQKKSEY